MVDENYLRKLLASGQITQEQLSQMPISGGVPNMLAQAMQGGGQMGGQDSALFNATPGQGYQGLQSGQGVIQQTNEDGSQNAPIRIDSQPRQQMPERDMTRNAIDLPTGRGYYGKDGQVYNANGSLYLTPETQARNQAMSMAEQDRQMKMAEMLAKTEHAQAQTLTERQKLQPQAYKPHFDTTNGQMIYGPDAPGGARAEPIPGFQQAAPKPTEGYNKQQTGVNNVIGALDSYKEALRGFKGTDYINPDSRANIETLYNNAMLQAKEAYNLGVLNGPDYEILTKVLTPVTSLRGTVTSQEALLKQVDTMQALMARVGKGSAEAHGQVQKPITRNEQATAPKYSDAEIQHTARKYGISPAEVKRQLGI